MKIAIIGYAGVGKTTITKMLNLPGYKVIHVDEIVNELYDSENIVSEYIRSKFPQCITDEKINKKILGDILLKNDSTGEKQREEFEDLLYKKIFFPMICDEKDIIVDGVLPRFADDFDLVLFAYINEEERIKRLKGRGVTPERIKQIIDVQKLWFIYLQ